MEQGNNFNQEEIIENQELQPEANVSTNLVEENNNGEEFERRRHSIIIVVIALLAIAVGGFVIFDRFLRIEKTPPLKVETSEETPVKEASEYTFRYDNYNLTLLKEIDNWRDFYAIDVKTDNYETYDLYGRYTNDKTIKFATIERKPTSNFEYRSLDVEDGKIYYMIVSKESGPIFELEYIDFNNLADGAKRISGFMETFKKDNLWQVNGKDAYHSSQIYVKDSDIFYTSYAENSLKKYNVKTEKSVIVIENISWFDYFIDKRNNYVYYQKEDKVYLADLNGKNVTRLKSAQYEGSNFWVRAYYNSMSVFGFSSEGVDSIDLYGYSLRNNDFIKIKESVHKYNIRYNNINMNTKYDNKILETFFIA